MISVVYDVTEAFTGAVEGAEENYMMQGYGLTWLRVMFIMETWRRSV